MTKYRIELKGLKGWRKTIRVFLTQESATEYAIRFYPLHTYRIVAVTTN